MISIITAAAGTAWAWLAPWIVKRGAVIGGVVAVIVAYFAWEGSIRSDERAKRDQQTVTVNRNATKIGERAAAKSGKPAPRGVQPLGYRE